MIGSKRFVVVAMAVVAIGTVGCGGGTVAPTSSSAAASPASSIAPSLGPAPTNSSRERASLGVPFTYVRPPGSGIDLGPDTAVLLEFRVPDSGGDSASAWFLFVQAIEGGRSDRCSPTSAPLTLDGGAQGAIDYLKTVPTVEISDETETMIDGYPAVSATVRLSEGTAECEELWIWATDVEPVHDVFRTGATVGRVTAIDVDGETVVLHNLALSRAEEWLPIVDALIASFEFGI